jgi:hypothetical protein
MSSVAPGTRKTTPSFEGYEALDWWLCFCFVFETGFYCAVQIGLELVSLPSARITGMHHHSQQASSSSSFFNFEQLRT